VAAAAGFSAELGKGIGVAEEDGGPVGALGVTAESGFFQHVDPGITGADEVDPCHDAFGVGIMEQGIDADPEGWQVHVFVAGGIEAIDADSPRLGKKVGGEIHLNGGMDFQQEQQAILVKDQVGAEGVVCLHTVIDLPEAFVGVELRAGAIEFMAKKFSDDGPVGFLTKGTQGQGSLHER